MPFQLKAHKLLRQPIFSSSFPSLFIFSRLVFLCCVCIRVCVWFNIPRISSTQSVINFTLNEEKKMIWKNSSRFDDVPFVVLAFCVIYFMYIPHIYTTNMRCGSKKKRWASECCVRGKRNRKIYYFRFGPKIDFTKIGTKRFCSCNPILFLKIYLSEIAMALIIFFFRSFRWS